MFKLPLPKIIWSNVCWNSDESVTFTSLGFKKNMKLMILLLFFFKSLIHLRNHEIIITPLTSISTKWVFFHIVTRPASLLDTNWKIITRRTTAIENFNCSIFLFFCCSSCFFVQFFTQYLFGLLLVGNDFNHFNHFNFY